MNFPTFGRIRAERAARELRGVVLPFQGRTIQQEIAAENARAISGAPSWTELWGLLFDIWEDVCLDTLDVMRHTALAALDGNIIDMRQDRMICDHMEVAAQAQERNRQAARREEAERNGQLIRELFEEF